MKLRSIKTFFFIIVYCLLFFGFRISLAKETIDAPFISAIIVNSKTNETIYSYNADTIIYPASLTKIMTAYIVFDAINEGIIGLYDRIDKTKGYIIENVQLVCMACNQIKSDMSEDWMYYFCKNIVDNYENAHRNASRWSK